MGTFSSSGQRSLSTILLLVCRVPQGHSYVVAQPGLEYGLVIHNAAAHPVLARITVDGKESWKWEAIPAGESAHVCGFRESVSKVRPMIFAEPGSMAASHGAETSSEVGCIAVDVFLATQHSLEVDASSDAMNTVYDDSGAATAELKSAQPDREKKIEITTAFGQGVSVSQTLQVCGALWESALGRREITAERGRQTSNSAEASWGVAAGKDVCELGLASPWSDGVRAIDCDGV